MPAHGAHGHAERGDALAHAAHDVVERPVAGGSQPAAPIAASRSDRATR